MKKLLLILSVALVGLLLASAGPAGKGGGPDKGGPPDRGDEGGAKPAPDQISVVFVDYSHPVPFPFDGSFTDEVGIFKVGRPPPPFSSFVAKWVVPAGGITYEVNTTGSGLSPAAALAAAKAGPETWDADTDVELFNDTVATTTKGLSESQCPSSLGGIGSPDGLNTVSWGTWTAASLE